MEYLLGSFFHPLILDGQLSVVLLVFKFVRRLTGPGICDTSFDGILVCFAYLVNFINDQLHSKIRSVLPY